MSDVTQEEWEAAVDRLGAALERGMGKWSRALNAAETCRMSEIDSEAGLRVRECPKCAGADVGFWQPCAGGGYGVACRHCHLTFDCRLATPEAATARQSAIEEAARAVEAAVPYVVGHDRDLCDRIAAAIRQLGKP